MTWFKVDDSLAMNRKAVEAGDAMALWVRAGAWCANQLTDGFVPLSMVPMLGGKHHADTLVKVGLWLEEPDGYRFHDWRDYQPTRSEVQERREKRASAGRIGGLNSGRSRREASASASAGTNASPVASTLANPRPVPVPKEREGAQRPPATTRGTRLPEGWRPSPELVEQLMADLGRDRDWFKAEHAKFCDFWHAESGQRAAKKDWNAAYRLWCRRGAESNVRKIPTPTGSNPTDKIWRELGVEA